jgi:nitroreductase
MAAPSASNRRPWHFIAVRDDRTKAQLARTHRWSGMIDGSALCVAVCAETARAPHWVEDTSAATQNMLLAAAALGLGAVWIGIHPDSGREDAVRECLGIPGEIGVLCLVALGRPAEQKTPRDSFSETRVHSERW